MNPITPVLNEIRRVLSPGGRFAALVNGPDECCTRLQRCTYNLIYGYVQAKLPKYGEIDLGDPRIRSADSLGHLAREVFPEAKVTVETSVVSMKGPVSEVAETTAGFFMLH